MDALFCWLLPVSYVRRLHTLTLHTLCLLIPVAGWAQEQPSVTVLPWQDDATLHDLQFVGSRIGYACGDQGMVWRTEDGGTTWAPCPTPGSPMLRTITFLTAKHGWVAGTRWQPYTRLAEGVLFATSDGGTTWQEIAPQQLPGIVYIRFFSQEEGVAVTHPSAAVSSGLYRTTDGGMTWQPLQGEGGVGWLAGLFVDPQQGFVANRKGSLFLIGGDQLLTSRLPELGSRSIRGLTLQNDETGWLVGDGGLALKTASGGVVWEAPAGPLPDGLRFASDFRAVEAKGNKVWLGGNPGSVIWHSPDGGTTWQSQRTGSPTPLNKLKMVSETTGFAVGEFGVILRTDDGGEHWQILRGQNRKAGWLALLPEPQDAPVELAARLSAEEGYRGVLWSASFASTGTVDSESSGPRFQAAAHAVRTNVAGISWQLPVDRPDLLADADALLKRWQNRAEQRAPLRLVDELVRQIRVYRPEVVLLPYAAEGDALASFIQQAGRAALAQAADPTRGLEHRELCDLSPWQVKRVLVQLSPGSQGDVTLPMNELSPRLCESLKNWSAPAVSLLPERQARRAGTAWRRDQVVITEERHSGGIFGGMEAPAGSAIRRALLSLREVDLERVQKQVQRQRNFGAISERSLSQPVTSGELVGQLPDVLRDLSVEQSVVVLSDLANRYRQQAEFEHTESTYLELVRRHPDHPSAVDAMSWLIKYWSSGEMATQRLRGRGQSVATQTGDPAALQSRIQQANAVGGGFLAAPRSLADVVPAAGRTVDRSLMVRNSAGAGAPPDAIDQWRRRASDLAQQIQRQSPLLFQRPEIQFPLASLRRASKSPGQSDAIYRQFQLTSGQGAMSELVEQELWVSQGLATPPRRLATARLAQERPYLDGVLSDPCWRDAKELTFGAAVEGAEEVESSGLVLFCYDDEYLYIAATARLMPDQSPPSREMGDREYDADLAGFDRLGIALDLDRDYSTWYEFQVDSRGQTRDRCWEDESWNPEWYVARDVDGQRWQVEIAIPWSELTAVAPQPRDVWGLCVVRTLPHEGFHGTGAGASWPPQFDRFGLLRFE